MVKRPKRAAYVPDRGELVWLSFDPQAGHEQSGRRPAVVLSPRAYNAKSGLGLFAPVTSHIKGYPFEVILPNDLPISGAVLADQIRSLDWQARKTSRISLLPEQITGEILGKLGALLATS